MAVRRQRYEPVDTDIELGQVCSGSDHHDQDTTNKHGVAASRISVAKSVGQQHAYDARSPRKSSKTWLLIFLDRYRGQKTWRFGLIAGLYASLAVLVTNVAFLLYGTITHEGVNDGIATLMQEDMKAVSRMSTALHVLINILSTTLLTSSNYAMQVLCAPTRDEIDDTHENGQWLEIGLVSLHNLSRINKKRAILWWLLAVSSAPLHLL